MHNIGVEIGHVEPFRAQWRSIKNNGIRRQNPKVAMQPSQTTYMYLKIRFIPIN